MSCALDLLAGLLLIVAMAPSAMANAPNVDFRSQIAPLFEQHCVRCHSPLSAKGDLSVATSLDLFQGGYVVAGDPANSELLNLLTAADGQRPRMPQEGEPLSREQVQLIQRWIAEGAPWPAEIVIREKSQADSSWWSLQALTTTIPPALQSPQENGSYVASSRHPIDRFVAAKLAEQGLQPQGRADRRTLVRRLYFDLLGLPPSPAEVEAFVRNPRERAYEELVNRLLASPHFGERWARHWLDIAHYADTHGFERDQRRDHAWRYRDWVVRAFNDDKPYNQFLRQQIAGDAIAPHDPDSVIATGFLAAGPWDFVGQVETQSDVLRRSARALDLDDMVTQVMTASMGLTVNCARCHDHKLDPISQRDYYELWAVFAGLRRADRDVSHDARREYEERKTRLQQQLADVRNRIGRLSGQPIDLADIVGGGDGFGSGRKGFGIDPRTGKTQEESRGALDDVQPGVYSPCKHPCIDGVFIPGRSRTQATSTELFVEGLPGNGGQAWDAVRNGPVTSQFSTTIGDTDFQSDGHSLIGLHANAGVTFDLRAVRESVASAREIAGEMSFSTTVGYGGRLVEPSAEFWVFLDGQLKARQRVGRNDAVPIEFAIPTTGRFLTLISTDGGDGYGHDQISFGDPRLTLARVGDEAEAGRKRKAEIASLRGRQQSITRELEQLGEPSRFYGVVAEAPPAVHVLARGDPESPGERVAPAALGWGGEPQPLGSEDMPEAERRVALADWIVSPTNPLTARVIVNRLWHWHFGRGIVGTPSDFGYGGERPSHPELLDWLASELIQSDWSLKQIHRLIVTSQTYQMRSRVAGDNQAAAAAKRSDSDNRLLWRMNNRRLEAEAVRDAVLAVSGVLNTRMHGAGYRDFDYQEEYAPVYTYKTADAPDLWRRTVYRFVVRTTPPQFLTTLDCPDPANLTPKRNITTTALQSLALFNNDFMLRQAEYFADRLRREAARDQERIVLAFRLAFGRSPAEEEMVLALRLVQEVGLTQFCRALFNANEFLHVD